MHQRNGFHGARKMHWPCCKAKPPSQQHCGRQHVVCQSEQPSQAVSCGSGRYALCSRQHYCMLLMMPSNTVSPFEFLQATWMRSQQMPEQDRVLAFAGNGAAWSTKMHTAGVHDKASTLSAKHSSLKLELARKSWANPSWLGAKALCLAQVKACFFSCCHLSLVECLLSQRSFYDYTCAWRLWTPLI